MTNRNLGILIAVIAIAAAAICFAVLKGNNNNPPKSIPDVAASVEPAAEPTPSANDPVVATVDGKNVLRSEVLAFTKNFPPQMQQVPVEQLFTIAQEQVIAAKIVDAKAAKISELPTDPEVLKRLADAKTQIIRTVYLEKEIEKQLSDDRIQKAYDKFKASQSGIQEVHARHILVDKEETAKDIIKKIEGGAKFEDLAKEFSSDKSNKDNGGDLGYFTKEAMVKEFADAAFAMNKDEVSKTPVKTQFGWHVIQVLDKRNKPVPTLDDVKPQIAAEERRQILNELVESWRKKADVTTFDINGNPEKPADKKDAVAPKQDGPESKPGDAPADAK